MNNKYILLSLITTFLFARVQAQKNQEKFSFSGTITAAAANTPLAGASVYISDLRKGSVANATGHFQINNIPYGTYLAEVRYVGYKSILTNISFNKNIEENYAMEISVTEENEIVVTGSSKATSIRRNPIPIISISKQYLQQNLSTNVIDAISKIPGINAVTTGPNVSKPFIRGLGFNRILTLYDGVRQEGQQWGDEHGIEVDQNTVDKVEVVKGPASLIYGSDAVAGVVNLIPANPPADGKIIGNILNEYQTNNRLIENSASMAGNNKGFSWGGTLTHKLATNYKNKYDGRVYNTGFAETDASAIFGLTRKWGYSHLGISMFDDLQEIPDGSRDSATRKFTKQITEDDLYRPIVSDAELASYKISKLHQHVQHYRIYSSNSFSLGSGRLAINLAFQRSLRREFSHPEVAIPGLFLQLNTYSYDLKYYFHEYKGLSITAGLNGLYQDNKVDKGTEFIIPSYQQLDAGPFLFIKKSAGKLELAGGLRYDVRNFNNDALYTSPDLVTGFDKPVYGSDTAGAYNPFSKYSHTFSGVSGSAGLSYRFNDAFSMKANIGRGFRAPNISEISSNGVHPGTNAYQIGNVNFKPEFNLQEDLGITYNSKHVTINAEVFNNNIQNYIFNQKLLGVNGKDSVIVPGNQTFKFQAAKANLYGGELSIDIHPHPLDWLHFENSLSMVYGVNKGIPGEPKLSDSAKYLPFIPPLHTFSELKANIKKIGTHLVNGFVKVQMEYYAKQNRAYLENDTETPTPGYTLFNAGIGTDVINKKGNTILTIDLLADNIFNIAYQSHLNRLKYFEPYPGNFTGHNGIYNMGSNVSFKVNVPLNFK
ncbi:MAG: TonB-dependent receptor [Bacteroidota bacterium]|nr:TonB-dependent receptor [Bacteroidota bacterium]MDQ6889326.1 TonB-dependent receptor [Bacteroidota bacterium]MDQ6902699.1 TonB-dependent receptor [Bacteroidota bacterium]